MIAKVSSCKRYLGTEKMAVEEALTRSSSITAA